MARMTAKINYYQLIGARGETRIMILRNEDFFQFYLCARLVENVYFEEGTRETFS